MAASGEPNSWLTMAVKSALSNAAHGDDRHEDQAQQIGRGQHPAEGRWPEGIVQLRAGQEHYGRYQPDAHGPSAAVPDGPDHRHDQ
jgi:hypothetical protein